MTDDHFTQLTTPRLCLRRFREADAEAFAGYRSDPAVARYQDWDSPYPVEQARRFATGMAEEPADVPGEWLQIAVTMLGDDALVGDCAFSPLAHEPRTVEIGFTIAPAHQGRGYAREAVSSLLAYLFGQLGKHRVTASCDARNTPSVKVLEAVGMRREGHLVESTWAKGEWTDDLIFALLGREWSWTGPTPSSGTPS
jgi:aminoglycoside 6'-N-acetyltransferase